MQNLSPADLALEAALERVIKLSEGRSVDTAQPLAPSTPKIPEFSRIQSDREGGFRLSELGADPQSGEQVALAEPPTPETTSFAARPAASARSLLRPTKQREEPMLPLEPKTLEQTGLSDRVIEEIAIRYLFNVGEASGRQIADQLKLPFGIVEPTLARLKTQQFLAYNGSSAVHDYINVLSDAGRDRARRYNQSCTYFGAAPVPINDYIHSIKLQSVELQHPNRQDLARAFSDLLIPPKLLSRLGPAINSGRGMFLYGYPGNGKTSIAERVTRAFGEYIWLPRSVTQDGAIMRIFDPQVHEEAPQISGEGLLCSNTCDRRWVRIKRPTIVAGGELTMDMLEVAHNSETNISDAPLQLKSNCGVLLIDDFGRQRMSVDELLNRWIVPLEKRYDYLSISGGKKTQVPFDQLVIFSTNLEPKNLVDDAFLRRIPYKIEVTNPTEEAFRKLFEIMARVLKIPYRAECIDYLIEKHYKPLNRPFRNCHPRDLLLQIRSYCYYNSIPIDMRNELFDFAVDNYFSIM